MDLRRLPANSEQLLFKLICAENPTQILQAQYKGIPLQKVQELNGIIRELRSLGYIDVKWASNAPYSVTINNSARTYGERLSEHNAYRTSYVTREVTMRKVIFISHRSTDKIVADMLVDFFVGTGIPRTTVFCSSLPGNDINKKISDEVKAALKSSTVNIAILSGDYYQSAYCLNEAGVLWYCDDVPVIPVALPEIDCDNMFGFLNNEYKLRRLDSDDDISYIYDTVSERLSLPSNKHGIITYENQKLRERYATFLGARVSATQMMATKPVISTSEITTDDEKIVLYYILKKNVRKVSKGDICDWLHKSEVYGVNVDNAFDLLASFDGGTVVDETLEFGIDIFRDYSAHSKEMLPELQPCVKQHTKLAVDTFKELWNANALDQITCLFVAYIVDERMQNFGARWMEKIQVESIKRWESKNVLDSPLSQNYGSCLEFFIQNNLVYESSWTDYGNPREYSLCPSLQDFLLNCPNEIAGKLQKIKEKYYCELPF